MPLKPVLLDLASLNRGGRAGLWWTTAGFLPLYALVCCLLLLGAAGMALLNMGFTLPRHELTVGLNKRDVSLFRVLEEGAAPAFSDKDLDTMAAQPGVKGVYPISYGSLPTAALVSFFGRRFDTEMVVQGVDPDWLRPELAEEMRTWKPGELVPMVVNTSVLAIYNHAYAKSNNLPELSESALKTPIITLVYGPEAQPVEIRGRVIGLSPKVALGIAVPRAALVHLHTLLQEQPPPITEVVMRLEAGEDVRRARETVTGLGFVVNEPGHLLQVVGTARKLALSAFPPLCLLLCLPALLFLCQGYAGVMQVRRGAYLSRLAEGASRRRLCLVLLAEGGLVAGIHLLLGSALGYAAAHTLNAGYLTPYLHGLLSENVSLTLSLKPLVVLDMIVLGAALLLLLPRTVSVTRPDHDEVSPTTA